MNPIPYLNNPFRESIAVFMKLFKFGYFNVIVEGVFCCLRGGGRGPNNTWDTHSLRVQKVLRSLLLGTNGIGIKRVGLNKKKSIKARD